MPGLLPPVLHQGVAISDEEIVVRFSSPINDDYDYTLLYIIDQKTHQSPYSATYGPLWADSFAGLQPSTPYRARVFLMCSYNSSIKSRQADVSASTLGQCMRHIFIIKKYFWRRFRIFIYI